MATHGRAVCPPGSACVTLCLATTYELYEIAAVMQQCSISMPEQDTRKYCRSMSFALLQAMLQLLSIESNRPQEVKADDC